jgi:murein L,D-transpeptidase YcbB/YkuD
VAELDRLVEEGVPADRLGVPGPYIRVRSESAGSLDARLTEAFLRAATILASGATDPAASAQRWGVPRAAVPSADELLGRVEREGVGAVVDDLRAAHPGYRELARVAERYRDHVERGGWPRLAEGEALRLGDDDPRVATLARRLRITGDLASTGPLPSLLDEEVDAAVRRFQGRHGLDVDGVVGAETTRALNVPASERLATLQANLERLRWLPRPPPDRIEVNVPASTVRAWRGGRRVLELRAVVGRPRSPTPVFEDLVESVVFRPYWNVPRGIARRETLPALLAEPARVRSERYQVLDAAGRLVPDPEALLASAGPGWSGGAGRARLTAQAIAEGRYRIRQRPGSGNALGLVKFLFPNRHDVYLHDTSARHLFARAKRALSHGCVRVDEPARLAEHLLEGEEGDWSRERIDEAMAGDARVEVRLRRTVPIRIVYLTAWSEDGRTAHFRPDAYRRDEALLRELAPAGPLRVAAASPAPEAPLASAEPARRAARGEEARGGEPALVGVVGEDERALADLVDHRARHGLGQGGTAPAPSDPALVLDELLAHVPGPVHDEEAVARPVVHAALEAVEAQRPAVLADVRLGRAEESERGLLASPLVREARGEALARVASVGDELVEEHLARRQVEHPEAALRGGERVVDDREPVQPLDLALASRLGRGAQRELEHRGGEPASPGALLEGRPLVGGLHAAGFRLPAR